VHFESMFPLITSKMQLLCIWRYSHFKLTCFDMIMQYTGRKCQACDALNNTCVLLLYLSLGLMSRTWINLKWTELLYLNLLRLGRYTWQHLYARSQNCETRLTASSYLSVRPSVCPHGTRLPLNGLSWNLIFDYFPKICPEISSFTKIWQE
jgi:hypothetical protein